MIAGVADTHAALWYLFGDQRLASRQKLHRPGSQFRPQDRSFSHQSGRDCVSDRKEPMRQVPRAEVRDMPDRMVAATAVYFGVPVISRDGRIRASSLKTVW
jgi:PIN domain nuclease of toxin-antitoxin system